MRETPHPAAFGCHPLPQGERVHCPLGYSRATSHQQASVGFASLNPPCNPPQATVKNGSGAPSVGLNTSFTFCPIFKLSMSQSTMLVWIDGPSFKVTYAIA